MPRLSKLNAANVFIDSNIWLYAFTAHPLWGDACHDLLKKSKRGRSKVLPLRW